MAKKGYFHTRPLLTTQFSLKTNFLKDITEITCGIYAIFVVRKRIFFMTVELQYKQDNYMISLISQVLIGLYLILIVHTHTTFLLELVRVSIFGGDCSEKGGDLFQGGAAFA